jgi:hypothetical protein
MILNAERTFRSGKGAGFGDVAVLWTAIWRSVSIASGRTDKNVFVGNVYRGPEEVERSMFPWVR